MSSLSRFVSISLSRISHDPKNKVDKINNLDSGTEISMSELWQNEIKRYKLEFNDLFDMNEKILDMCEEKNIKLNFDKYDGACVGLPYDIPFIKE